MKAILRKNKTDPDMIEIITKSKYPESRSEFVWAVVQEDFIVGEDIQLDFNVDGELEIEIKVCRK